MPDPTSNTPAAKSGVNGGIRITTSLIVGISLGIFMLTWDSNLLVHTALPDWMGPFVFMPLISLALGTLSTCLVQQLSCGRVQWMIQLQRTAIFQFGIVISWAILSMMPGLRWPIEGLIQSGSPALRKGLSSGFYAFWLGMYCQSMLTSAAQLCPR